MHNTVLSVTALKLRTAPIAMMWGRTADIPLSAPQSVPSRSVGIDISTTDYA